MSGIVRIAVVMLAALAAAPAAAHAAFTVSYSSSTGLLIQGDASSDGARVSLPVNPPRYRVAKNGVVSPDGEPIPEATLIAGSGCSVAPDGAIAVECPASGNLVVTANLGDGADSLSGNTFPSPRDMFVDGGSGSDLLIGGLDPTFDALDGAGGNDRLAGRGGDDVLEGGDGNDLFNGDGSGNPGTDTIRGEGGNDTFTASGGSVPHPDLFDGGPGVDRADYSQRGTPVDLSTSIGTTDSPNDGAPIEGDDLDNVETLIGGSANDALSVMGNAREGVRTLTGNGGADKLSVVGSVPTFLDAGLGTDSIGGGNGTDTIFSRDGEKDKIDCDAGVDQLTADLRDTPVPVSCENVDQGAVKEGPHVIVRSRSLRVDEDGSLSVRLGCPRRLRIRCAGTLAARLDTRSRFGPRKRYSIRPGRSATVKTELPAAQRAAARRRRVRVRVRSVERGTHGPKTTLRSLPARRG